MRKIYLTNNGLQEILEGQDNLIQDDWIKCELDENGQPYIKYLADGKPDLVEIEKELNEKIYNDKWDLVSKYLTNEIPNILDNNGNEYIVKNGEIENIRKKFFDWNDTESYNWVQYNIPTFVTHKLQLAVVMQKYNELEQLKINEIFELGEV